MNQIAYSRHFFVAFVMLFVAACSSNNGPITTGIPSGAPSSVQFQQNTLQAVASEDSSTQLNLIASFDDGTSKAVRNFDVTELADWSSSNNDIANVSNTAGTKGLVFGANSGNATITASFRGVSTDISFTVLDATLERIDINPASISLVKGTSRDITISARYSDGTTLDVTEDATLSVANTDIATVTRPDSASARVNAVEVGSTTLNASFGDFTDSATITVQGVALQSLTLSPSSPSIANGRTVDFALQANFADGSTQDVTEDADWLSDNPNVVSVSSTAGSKGIATAQAVGTATIRASFSGTSQSTVMTVTDAVLDRLEIDPANPSIADGTKQQFAATAIYSDGSNEDVTSDVSWESSDETVAVISDLAANRGEATALDVGQTTITATLQNETPVTTVLTVTSATPTALAIEPPDSSVALNRTQQFSATATFTDNSTQDVTSSTTWDSDDQQIVSFSNLSGEEGLAQPQAEGSVTVTATYAGFTQTTQLTVNPNTTVSSIIVSASNSASFANGTTEQLIAVANYADGSTDDVTTLATWTSANDAIATVSNDAASKGLVTGQGVGQTDITATLEGVSGDLPITVTAALLQSISVTPVNPSVPVQQSQKFIATGRYSDNTEQNITANVLWSSSNENVATVSNQNGDNKGLANGITVGSATITATQGEFSGSSVLTVTDALLQSIQIQPASTEIADGIYVRYSATGLYSDGTSRDLTDDVNWSSSDADWASISNIGANSGRALSKAPAGSVPGDSSTFSIQAVLDGEFASATMKVTVATLDSLTISNEGDSGPLDLPKGLQTALVATGTFSSGVPDLDLSDQVSWTTDSDPIASISQIGFLEAKDLGTTSIRAKHTHPGNATETNDDITVTVSNEQIATLEISPLDSSVPNGNEVAYTATGTYTNGAVLDVTDSVNWTATPNMSGNATIGADGVATATAVGDVTITAKDPVSEETASTGLTVTAAVLVQIEIESAGNASSIAEGQTLQFTAEGTYSDDSSADITDSVTWVSSAASVASISNVDPNEGEAEGLSAGVTQIAAGDDGIDSNAITLSVTDAVITSIAITPNNDPTDQAQGTNRQFTAMASFSDGTTDVDVTNQVTWSSNEPALADVSNATGFEGLVFVKADATVGDIVTISAQADGEEGTSAVRVTDGELISIQISPANDSVTAGDDLQFTAMGYYSDGRPAEDITTSVDWFSLDESIATIENGGLATGVADGVTSIRAADPGSDVEASTSLTVTP